MGKKTTRIILDVLLTLMIVFEMFIQYTGDFLHEVIGLAFFLTVVAHLGLSAKWMKNTAAAAKTGKLTGRRTALAVMAGLLAITMIILGISSVAISNVLASAGFVWSLGSYDLWVVIHTISSYALCALVAVHLAMHWAFLFSAFKVPYNPARRKAIGTSVHALAALGVIALGVTAAREVLPQSQAQTQTQTQTQTRTRGSNANQLPDASDIQQDSSSGGKRKKNSSDSSAAATQSNSASSSTPSSSADSTSPSESSSSESTSSETTGICTLCRKRCSLSDPKCDKPYAAGLI